MKKSPFKKNKNLLTYISLGVLLFIIYLFQSVGAIPHIFGLIPAVTVIYTVVCASVCGEYIGCIIGLVGGLFCDAGAPNSYCFNLIVLTALGITCGLLSAHLFTKRFLSVLFLSAVSVTVYFILHWLIIQLILGNDNMYYLIRYSLPSVLYSILFIFPIYPLVKIISKRNA